MKKAFTLIEVIILLVIFVMVALLVIPLSVDDTMHAKNIAKWKQVYGGFSNIPTTIKITSNNDICMENFVQTLIKIHPLNKVTLYKIKYMNGEVPKEEHTFSEIYNTDNGASIAYKWYEQPIMDPYTQKEALGILMYDVNAKHGPNVWGKDIFGLYIYKDNILPIGINANREDIEFDCSRQGTGTYCSTYYIQGGTF